MLKFLPQSNVLYPVGKNVSEITANINSYIEDFSCENMSVDISLMNIIDACHVSTLCSTKHYIKYPEGKIQWRVSSSLVKEFNKDLELGNREYLYI